MERNAVGLAVGLTVCKARFDEVIEESGFLLEEGIQGHDVAVCAPASRPPAAVFFDEVRGLAGEEVSGELLLQVAPLVVLDIDLDVVFLLEGREGVGVGLVIAASRHVDQDFFTGAIALDSQRLRGFARGTRGLLSNSTRR